jgi:hypothetical protein
MDMLKETKHVVIECRHYKGTSCDIGQAVQAVSSVDAMHRLFPDTVFESCAKRFARYMVINTEPTTILFFIHYFR